MSRTIRNVREIVALLGGRIPLAEKMGVTKGGVSHWQVANTIPIHWRPYFTEELRKINRTPHPEVWRDRSWRIGPVTKRKFPQPKVVVKPKKTHTPLIQATR